jgi:hypothetical protein
MQLLHTLERSTVRDINSRYVRIDELCIPKSLLKVKELGWMNRDGSCKVDDNNSAIQSADMYFAMLYTSSNYQHSNSVIQVSSRIKTSALVSCQFVRIADYTSGYYLESKEKPSGLF